MRIPKRIEALTALVFVTAIATALQVGAAVPFVSASTNTQSWNPQSGIPPSTLNNTGQVGLQLQPPNNTVIAGAFAKFGISFIGNSTSPVSFAARGIPPSSVAIFTPNGGIANPVFNSTLTIVTSGATPTGIYVVTAIAVASGGEFARNLTVQVSAPPITSATNIINASSTSALVMTVNTARSQYQPNSTVNIEGQVTDGTGNAISNTTVMVQVDGPNGTQLLYSRNLATDIDGSFRTQVSLPSSSLPGTYTVFASSMKAGYSSTTTRTTFVVGTSTTPSIIIREVYAGDNSGNPNSIFGAGQTIWVWVVIQNIGATSQGIVWIQVRDPNGVPVQIQIHDITLGAGQTISEGLSFGLLQNATNGVYTVNALVSDKLISQGGTFLASSEAQFALTG